MQSEKKYKTKAAQEYKRFLTKALTEENSVAAIPDKDPREGTLESPQGLDGLMRAMSGVGLSEQETVLASTPSQISNSPKPTEVPTPPVFEAKGTLSVEAVTTPDVPSESSASAPQAKLPVKMLSKKPSVSAKKSSVKRLGTTSSAELRLESFEAVEKRTSTTNKATVDEEQESSNASSTSLNLQVPSESQPERSSRLAAIYAESEANSNRSGPGPGPVSSSPYGGGSSPYGGISKPTSFSSSSSTDVGVQKKYGNAKGISSDQLFGNNEEELSERRGRLVDRYSSSNAISSDMLQNDGEPDGENSGEVLGIWKNSVKGFFDDMQRRIG